MEVHSFAVEVVEIAVGAHSSAGGIPETVGGIPETEEGIPETEGDIPAGGTPEGDSIPVEDSRTEVGRRFAAEAVEAAGCRR